MLYGSYYSESPISLLPELVQTLTVILTHRIQKAFVMLRVSNIAHLLTKPDQVAKAGRLERKPKQPNIKSSTSPKPKRKQNKEVKTSLLV